MNKSPKIYAAVIAILAASAKQASAGPQTDASASSSDQLQQVVVTATRRSENIQDVPITMTALTAEKLAELNVTTFQDYVKFLPNVTVANQGPGQGQIYMRGLATTASGEQYTGGVGSFPNVAVYLDDQSEELPGRNLDIYAADLERIEVLEGPQGTLFGAGAQAGVIRYITNKPKVDKFEFIANGGYGVTAGGDPSSNLDLTVNFPVIKDVAAVRLVVYNESRGGYINNVPGIFTRKATDPGIQAYFGGVLPPINESASNSLIAASDINPVTYKGARLSGTYWFNDKWNLLITQTYQSMEADGVFGEMPVGPAGNTLPDLSVNLFTPSWDKDKFSNTAWTLTGKIGQLKALYTGGYLVRNVDQVADYTNYNAGFYGPYYSCILPNTPQAVANGTPQGACLSPLANYRVQDRNIHQSHELRVSTPDDWRLRAIGGLFYEKFLIQDQSDWYYRAPGTGFIPLIPPVDSSANNHNPRDPLDAFFNDIQRGYNQKAAYLSVDYDIIPKILTLTAGTRYYSMYTFEKGAKVGSFDCRPGGLYPFQPGPVPGVCDNGLNLDTFPVPPGNEAYSDSPVGLKKTYTGAKSRVNITWRFMKDGLAYYTWSQGFRPGGFNRSSGFVGSGSPLAGSFLTPIGFAPDTLTNNEIGFKTLWFDHRLLFNGTLYREDWNNVQISLFDPGLLGNLTFTTNGPNYRVTGFETEVSARVYKGLSVQFTAAWNRSELVNTPVLRDKNGNPLDFAALGLQNPYGQPGSPLAQSPPFSGTLTIRDDFALGSYDAFWQIASSHRAHEYATTDRLSTERDGASVAYDLPAYSTYDLSFGIAKDAWNVQLYGSNMNNSRGLTFASYAQQIRTNYPIRPRTIMLRVGYRFTGD